MKQAKRMNRTIRTEEPIKNLARLAVMVAGLLFTYFCGHVTLLLLWRAELVELPYTDQHIFAITMALGLPWLLAQIAAMKYAYKLLNTNVFNS
jgi:hypothetical protein